jgi:hypothetical protein
MRGRLLTQIIGLIVDCAIPTILWGAAPTTRPVLQHVPDEPSQARAERMIREVYSKELAARDLGERRLFVQKLIAAAIESGDDPAARFVLLREARNVAAASGDAFAACRAITLIGKFYAVDQTRMVLAAMNSAQAAAGNSEALAEVVQVCLNTADRAVIEEDFITAAKLLATAETAGAKTKSLKIIDRVKEGSKLLQSTIAEFDAVQKAREALKRDAGDAEASARVGRFLCLTKGDWNAGLSLIANGAESPLRKLAQDDLAAIADARKRFPVAEGWWDLSLSQTWLARKNLQARSAWWCRQVAGELNGIHRSIADRRIELVELAALAEQNLVPGLEAELFKGMDFKQLVKQRVDDQINFDWGTESPDAAVGKDNFAIRWSGALRPATAGNYEMVVLANTGVRLWVDEKLVLENANLARNRNGVRIIINLDEQVHPLRLEFWDSSGAARMKLLWRRPGTVKDEVIPASVFFHEGLVEGP